MQIKLISTAVIAAWLLLFPPAVVSKGTPRHPVAENGVLDLRNWDFDRQGPVRLSGEWAFFWEYFAPLTKAEPAAPGPVWVRLPASWTTHKIDGKALPGDGFATYRLRIQLPENPPPLALKFLDMATAFRVYANKKEVYRAGIPGKNRQTTTPAYRPEVVPVSASLREIELVIHAANFDHWQGGMWEPVFLGAAKELHRMREKRLFTDAILFGAIFIMAIYHLCLYRFRPEDRSTLFLGLFCLMIAVRPISHGERFLLEAAPWLSYDLLMRLNYISFYFCVPLFTLFTRCLFPREVSKTVATLVALAGGLASVFTAVTVPRLFSGLMPLLQGATLLLLCYGAWAVSQAIRRKKKEAVIFLAGFAIFTLTILNDVLYSRQMIYTTQLVPFGLFVFILCQAILISRRFSRAFFTVSRQQQILEAEVARRKRIEADLLESEAKFREMAEFLPIPLLEHDLSLQVSYANRAAFRWFGLPVTRGTEDLNLASLLTPDGLNHIRAGMDGFRMGQPPKPAELMIRKMSGTDAWVLMESAPIMNKDALAGGRICLTDLTERKAAEAAALVAAEQEKYALIGQVAGKMAHDFNNILGAIMGNTELSILDCNEANIRDSLSVILDQTKRGQILTRNLVAFAKDQEPKEECFSINEKIELVLILLKKDLAGIRLTRELAPDLPDLFADPGMIEQALVNIIQNAIHAMSLESRPELAIKTCLASEEILIEIRDNGCGIPVKYHKDIYTPSFTLKGTRDEAGAYKSGIKGTGYGMANVKKYIDKHGGTVSFTSQTGTGTSFVLSLPVLSDGCKETIRTPKQPVKAVRGKRILVVEDEAAISVVLEKILTSPPFANDVVVATDARSAMARFEQHKFDLVSLDYMLPGNESGMDVYRFIRNVDTRVPVIFVSGNFEFIESIKALREKDPFLDYLSKPCENIKYSAIIRKWLK